jgi:glycosyltransferase involved in cell wall biosynthesis
MTLSVVIPTFNERDSLEHLHEEIAAVAREHELALQIIFVDDGSTDGSWEVIRALAESRSGVEGIRFRRNFGKAAALAAGIGAAQGRSLLTLDADLQDDPAEIPRFLKALDDGLDVVSGWKQHRQDPWHKVLPSKVFNFLVNWMMGLHLHDHNCGMKLYRAELFREIRLYGELHRFIPALAHARGFRVGEIAIRHRPRRFGRSKYGPARFIKGFLDLLTVKFLTGFGQRPQHLLGGIGLVSFAAGAAGLTYLAVLWFFIHVIWNTDQAIGTRPLLLYSISALLLGAQLVSIGFLAELITAFQSRTEEAYSICDRVSGRRDQKQAARDEKPRADEESQAEQESTTDNHDSELDAAPPSPSRLSAKHREPLDSDP